MQRFRPARVTAALIAICVWGVPAAAEAASTQVLRVAMTVPAEGGSLDPNRSSYLDSTNFERALIAPLYRTGSDGKLVPFLAVGQPRVSGGGKVITVTLRAGAKWSDGKPIIAQDVATGFARARESYFGGFLINVRRVVPVSARVARIELKRADPTVISMLATLTTAPAPTHVVKRAGNRWTMPGTMVSSGPFRLVSKSRTKWVMARNVRWWGAARVRLQRIDVAVNLTSAAVDSGMKSGRYDATVQNLVSHPEALAGTHAVSDTVPTIGTQYAYLNTTNAKLANPAVRRGIALAIDRAGIVAALGGRGNPATRIVPSRAPGASSETALLSTSGSPDVTAARAELAAGGWVPGTQLVLAYPSVGGAQKVAEAIQSSLAAVNATVILTPLTGTKFATAGVGISPVRPGIDMVLQGWIADYADPYDFLQLFRCASIKMGLNNSNYCNATYDRTVAPLLTQFSWPARVATAHRSEAYLTGPGGSMPAVPLYEQHDRSYRQSWVRGWLPNAFGEYRWEGISIAPH